MTGNPVTVSYYGKLDSNVSVQEVELLSITVTDADSNIENSETTGETSENIEPTPPPAAAVQKLSLIHI